MPDETRLRVLVADDEPLARIRIEDLLAAEPNVEVVGSVADGAEAVRSIQQLRPDVVFLDVQMPLMTGMDVIREVGADNMPATIFVTAYDKYALAAFESAALDYLVKPYDDERFAQALSRARRYLELERLGELRERLLALLGPASNSAVAATGATRDDAHVTETDAAPAHTASAANAADGPNAANAAPAANSNRAAHSTSAARSGPRTGGWLERIAVDMRGKVRVVPVSQIEYILASGPYVQLYVGGRPLLLRESLQSLEERLNPAHFLRIHRSAIVRLDLVEVLHKGAGGDYEVQLKGGARLKVSRSRREELERAIGVTEP